MLPKRDIDNDFSIEKSTSDKEYQKRVSYENRGQIETRSRPVAPHLQNQRRLSTLVERETRSPEEGDSARDHSNRPRPLASTDGLGR
jgi:hypothetical protein